MCISRDAVINPILKLVNFHRTYIRFRCVLLLILFWLYIWYLDILDTARIQMFFSSWDSYLDFGPTLPNVFWNISIWMNCSHFRLSISKVNSILYHLFFLQWIPHSINGLTMYPASQVRNLELFFLSIPQIQ